MKQEDKDLLLKDLCGRLPYGVKAILKQTNCHDSTKHEVNEKDIYSFRTGKPLEEDHGQHDYYKVVVTDIKPYLFPMSSMTEDIEAEIYAETGLYDIKENDMVHIEVGTNFLDVCKLFNILNKHHLDYNNLIPKGLAKDATYLNIY